MLEKQARQTGSGKIADHHINLGARPHFTDVEMDDISQPDYDGIRKSIFAADSGELRTIELEAHYDQVLIPAFLRGDVELLVQFKLNTARGFSSALIKRIAVPANEQVKLSEQEWAYECRRHELGVFYQIKDFSDLPKTQRNRATSELEQLSSINRLQARQDAALGNPVIGLMRSECDTSETYPVSINSESLASFQTLTHELQQLWLYNAPMGSSIDGEAPAHCAIAPGLGNRPCYEPGRKIIRSLMDAVDQKNEAQFLEDLSKMKSHLQANDDAYYGARQAMQQIDLLL